MKKTLLAICLAFISFAAFSQSDAISNIAQKLSEYYQFYPLEQIQVTTDKDVYKPEEIIWFKVLVTNPGDPQTGPVSSDCKISLYSANGNLISEDVYKISSGNIKGDLLVPKGMAEGKYVLAATTSLMDHANEAFLKLIYINPRNEQAIRLKELESPELLVPGHDSTFSFQLEEMDGKPLKNARLQFELYHQNEIVLKDKVKADGAGVATISLSIPEKDYAEPLKLVVSTNKNELNYTKILSVKNEKLKVSFYPEGGRLIAGTPQKLGFKATDGLGQPVNVEGDILDETGKKLIQVKTAARGLGVFPVLSEKGKKQTLQITSAHGEKQQFSLPEAVEGVSMAVPKIDGQFIYTDMVPDKNRTVYMLANKGKTIFWASEIVLEKATRIKIPKDDFPHGISILSAFDAEGQVLGSHLVFIDKKPEMKLGLSAPETVQSGEVLKFTVNTSDLSSGSTAKLNITISAADENTGWPNRWDSWQLVNSELENSIHHANELQESPNVESTINYLLIANRFKNFDWNKILHFDQEQEQHKYQNSGVSGKILDKNGDIVPKAKVSLVNSQNMQIINASADEFGEFYIQGVEAKNLGNFATKVIGPDGNENLRVEFEKTKEEQLGDQIKTFVREHASLEQVQYDRDFYRRNGGLFSKMKSINTNPATNEPAYKKYLQSATSLIEVIKIIKPFNLQGDLIIFPGGNNSINAQDGALIVVDGQKMGTSASVLNSFSPLDVESINISTNPVDIQRYTGLNSVGLIEITTKRGEQAVAVAGPTETIFENGYRVPRDFWLKKSEAPGQQPTTLFWEPAITINKNGDWEFEAATNQVTGKFLLRVDAIDREGRITNVSKTFEVVP
jgi:hypothetical protein